MERVALVTNARLRNAINRYSRYIVVCLRHVKTVAGRMQLNWLLNAANLMRSNAIECSTLRNKHRVNRLNRETLVIIDCEQCHKNNCAILKIMGVGLSPKF